MTTLSNEQLREKVLVYVKSILVTEHGDRPIFIDVFSKKEAMDSIMQLFASQRQAILKEVREEIEAQKYINGEVHGRSDCKSCSLMERIEDKLDAMEKKV